MPHRRRSSNIAAEQGHGDVLQGIDIVLVEDDVVLALILKKILSVQWRVLCVHSASDAVQLLRASGSFNGVILADLHLRDYSWRSWVDFLASQQCESDSSVVIMHGGMTDPLQQKHLSYRRFDIVKKPFLPEQIVETVRGVFEQAPNLAA